MPGPHDVDDLDFSDLDLDSTGSDFDDGFDDAAMEEPAGKKPRKAKKEDDGTGKKGPDMFTLAVYGAIGLAIVGAVVWQLGLFKAPEPTPYTADGTVPVEQPVAMGTDGQPVPVEGGAPAAGQPGTSDPFNVMGTPAADPNAASADPNNQAALTEAMNSTGTEAPVPTDQLPPATVPNPDAPVTSVMPATEANTPVEGTSAIPGAPATADGSAVPMPEAVPVADDQAATAKLDAQAFSPTPAAGTTASSPELSVVMDRLDALEKRIDAQEHTGNAAVAGEIQDLKSAVEQLQTGHATKSGPETASVSDEAPKAAPVKKKKTAAKKKSSTPKKKKATSEWDAPYNGGGTASAESTAASSTSAYNLRAAQPGAAWVSGSDGVLQEVRVGDSLPGVGEVQAISQSGGRWTVSGSQGKIAQ